VKSLRPRKYQEEAAKWALQKGRATVCMPTGTGKTVVAGLWIKKMLERGARRVLVLEPTRFLVEQVAWFLRERMGLDARPVHGGMPRGLREKYAREARVVVATPELVAAELDYYRAAGFDAVVVDECHHTSGMDSYRVVMESLPARWRLGLSAFIPPSRRGMIERLVGEIRCWGWDHPEIRRYIPAWVAEVYEAPFNEAEMRVYEYLEEAWARASGHERALIGNAMRWMARDGPLALEESYRKEGSRLRQILPDLGRLLDHPWVRPLHKLHALVRALEDHEGFHKAIVFVDRVRVAEAIAASLPVYKPVLLVGRRRVDPQAALEAARSEEARVIIATSAGEEGIDLPEADLLVVWSNTASPLRFVQRMGRVLRAAPRIQRQRSIVYIATPDTVDMDSLIDGLMLAQKHGVHVGLDPEVLTRLIGLSKRRRILEALSETPAPLDVVARLVGAPVERVKAHADWLARHGYLVYIHTSLGRIYTTPDKIPRLYEEYRDSLTPVEDAQATVSIEGYPKRLHGPYHKVVPRLQRILEKTRTIPKAAYTVQGMKAPGIVVMRRYTYTFQIDSWDKLKLTADNAYSLPGVPIPGVPTG